MMDCGSLSDDVASALDQAPCKCRAAVQRCYTGLSGYGQPEQYALEAAITVYRYHHPECSPDEAETVVSRWVAGSRHH